MLLADADVDSTVSGFYHVLDLEKPRRRIADDIDHVVPIVAAAPFSCISNSA
jgi:hypothetical protein